ncbi:MAG: OmpH family outer membrane protein [Bdellovibrionales bacterium]|nr:OmpH family outer membrane protein [Bdellovibrionales bacterium]
MKKIILCILGIFSCISFSAWAKKVSHSGLKTAYVSVNEAVEQTGEQKKIGMALEKERKRIQKLIRKKSEKFNTEAVKIRKEMALLSDEEKMKKYESIQKMQMAMEQFIKEKEIEFQQTESSLRSSVINRIKVVVNSVAKKEKVDVVRNKDGTLWVHPNMDLTSRVVSVYKKKYKK